MVVAQLVEQSLPLPEVCGLNPVIGKNLFILNICLLSTVYWKDENKEKEAGDGPFFKKIGIGYQGSGDKSEKNQKSPHVDATIKL